MEYGFARDRLPRGLAYPLDRGQLDTALSTPLAEQIRWVAFSGRRSDACLLARYWGEADLGQFAARTVWLSLYAVPSSEREAVRSLLLADGLPRLVQWLGEAECRGPSWRAVDHRIEFGMRCGRLIAREDRAMAGAEGKFHAIASEGAGLRHEAREARSLLGRPTSVPQFLSDTMSRPVPGRSIEHG